MEWVIESGLTIGRAFLQPFIYLFVLFIFLSGYIRIKKDRKNIGSKVYSYFYEARYTLSISIMMGIGISILSIVGGFAFSLPFALLTGVIMLIAGIAGRFSWLSAGYTLSIAGLITAVIQLFGAAYLPAFMMEMFQDVHLIFIPFLIGMLLIAEAWQLSKVRSEETFPEYIDSGRGKKVGQHRIKKIMLIPFIALVPGGWLEPFADWWPLIDIGENSYGLILVPFLQGFEYVAKTRLPQQAGKWLAKWNLLLAFVILALSIAGYFVTWITYIALALALLGKEFIVYYYRNQEHNHAVYFQPHHQHLLVLGVIADTPAVDLGLVPGEQIVKVNDVKVSTEEEFYHAVNQNRAYCKISVRDLNGEIRFAQRALYEGEHYNLGILFVSK
ncbi:PDZ domain-containing protein [Gracilibacillus alcaliphilus]|uniref:PDZ domain-containing protein n=1 Tax=Gracilibacillus alcaliphilus TaxID=1401441 RepID=UPI00195B4780|nr:PDZ domain-containing protein [Gracilibacillus alcaliphilus]MBM7675989.1 hypothetical protein [Gracilibacillus alcaliphilus]